MLEVVGLALVEGSVYVRPEQLPVVGMRKLHEPVEGWDELLFVTVDPKDLVRPGHYAGLRVPLPAAEAGYALRLCQPRLTLA